MWGNLGGDLGAKEGEGEEGSRGLPPSYTTRFRARSKERYIDTEKGKSPEAKDRQDNLSEEKLARNKPN